MGWARAGTKWKAAGQDYFASRCKGGLVPPAENSQGRPLRSGGRDAVGLRSHQVHRGLHGCADVQRARNLAGRKIVGNHSPAAAMSFKADGSMLDTAGSVDWPSSALCRHIRLGAPLPRHRTAAGIRQSRSKGSRTSLMSTAATCPRSTGAVRSQAMEIPSSGHARRTSFRRVPALAQRREHPRLLIGCGRCVRDERQGRDAAPGGPLRGNVGRSGRAAPAPARNKKTARRYRNCIR